MDLLPIALRMDGRLAVVVGGGPVGARKAQGVLDAGGRVKLISPDAVEALQTLAAAGDIQWEKRGFKTGDLDGADLVFAATNVREINEAVGLEAKKVGALCNVVDAPAEGDFHSAAVVRQDGLVIGVNNASRNPGRAVKVKAVISDLLDTAPDGTPCDHGQDG